MKQIRLAVKDSEKEMDKEKARIVQSVKRAYDGYGKPKASKSTNKKKGEGEAE